MLLPAGFLLLTRESTVCDQRVQASQSARTPPAGPGDRTTRCDGCLSSTKGGRAARMGPELESI